jgi:hypothetical protein
MIISNRVYTMIYEFLIVKTDRGFFTQYLIFFPYTDISTQLKDELQVTVLVLIYEQLLPLLLFCLWKDQMAYSVLFWLTINIWM